MPHNLGFTFNSPARERREARHEGTSASDGTFSTLSALRELNPTGEGTRAVHPDIGEFTPPAPDLARIRQLTQEEQSPDIRRLRSTVADAMGRAMQTGEAHKAGSLIREIVGGFGQATENIARGARSRANVIAQGEFAPVAEAARLGFLQRSREASSNFEADLRREMMEREAAMRDELVEQSLSTTRRAPIRTTSAPTYNPYGRVATSPGVRTHFALRGRGGGGPSKAFTSGGGGGGGVDISPEEDEIIRSLPVNVLQPKPTSVGPSQSFRKRTTPFHELSKGLITTGMGGGS